MRIIEIFFLIGWTIGLIGFIRKIIQVREKYKTK